MVTVVASQAYSNLTILSDYLLMALKADFTVTSASTVLYDASSVTGSTSWRATGSGFVYVTQPPSNEEALFLGNIGFLEVRKSGAVAYTISGPLDWDLLAVTGLPDTGAPFFDGDDSFTGSNAGEFSSDAPGKNDLIYGFDGNDTISARGADDIVFGGRGADTIDGGDGSDLIAGDAGADAMKGGAGDDQIIVSGADGAGDTFNGGPGVDTLVISLATTQSGVLTNFDALASSIEILKGNGKPILGTSGANTIDLSGLTEISGVPAVDGGAGNDVLVGTGLAAVLLVGGEGDDTLSGGAGRDTLTGGGGVDSFLFDDALAKTNVDHIGDFVPGSDEIRLDRSFFKGLKLGDLKAKLLLVKKNADAARDKDDRLIYDTKTGEFRFDSDGKGGAKAKIIGILDGSPDKLGHSDIVIVA
jgi:Ca2+-binding RTX toxin-like protein